MRRSMDCEGDQTQCWAMGAELGLGSNSTEKSKLLCTFQPICAIGLLSMKLVRSLHNSHPGADFETVYAFSTSLASGLQSSSRGLQYNHSSSSVTDVSLVQNALLTEPASEPFQCSFSQDPYSRSHHILLTSTGPGVLRLVEYRNHLYHRLSDPFAGASDLIFASGLGLDSSEDR